MLYYVVMKGSELVYQGQGYSKVMKLLPRSRMDSELVPDNNRVDVYTIAVEENNLRVVSQKHVDKDRNGNIGCRDDDVVEIPNLKLEKLISLLQKGLKKT